MKKLTLVCSALFVSLFISCSDDDPTPNPGPVGDYVNGILVSNEGPFAGGSGSVTFMSSDLNTVEQNVYQNVNNDNVGNVLNSIGFHEDKAYLIANVSNKITIVDRYTFERENIIADDLINPRFFAGYEGFGYVSNWGDPYDNDDDYIAVIDLITESVVATIPVAFGPEKLIVANNNLYVAHKGGYGHNNIISVIDLTSYELEETIEVGYVPGSLVLDNRNTLWVLCEGIPAWTGNESNGSLHRINLGTNEVSLDLEFGTTEHPQYLTDDNGYLYYTLDGNVYKMRDTSTEIPTTAEISGVFFYGMAVNDGVLFGLDAKDFASNGSIEVYDMNNGNSFEQSIPAGIIPSGLYFNN